MDGRRLAGKYKTILKCGPSCEKCAKTKKPTGQINRERRKIPFGELDGNKIGGEGYKKNRLRHL